MDRPEQLDVVMVAAGSPRQQSRERTMKITALRAVSTAALLVAGIGIAAAQTGTGTGTSGSGTSGATGDQCWDSATNQIRTSSNVSGTPGAGAAGSAGTAGPGATGSGTSSSSGTSGSASNSGSTSSGSSSGSTATRPSGMRNC